MKILAIGNSFSQDATTYIEDIANSMGIEDITAANLYIPGCPLTKHAENLKTDELEYEYHRKLMKYDDKIDFIVKKSMEELIEMIERKEKPFNTNYVLGYYELYKKEGL